MPWERILEGKSLSSHYLPWVRILSTPYMRARKKKRNNLFKSWRDLILLSFYFHSSFFFIHFLISGMRDEFVTRDCLINKLNTATFVAKCESLARIVKAIYQVPLSLLRHTIHVLLRVVPVGNIEGWLYVCSEQCSYFYSFHRDQHSLSLLSITRPVF